MSKTFKDFLLESPYIDNSYIDDNAVKEDSLESWFDRLINFKNFLTTNFNGFTFKFYKKNSNDLIFCFIFDSNENIIGKLSGTIHIGAYTRFNISSIFIKEAFRNKGLTKFLYTFLLNQYDMLVSDDSLTRTEKGGSYYIWKSLGDSGKYNCYYYLQGDLHEVDNFNAALFNNDRIKLVLSRKKLNTKDLSTLDESPIFDDSNKTLGNDGLNPYIFNSRKNSKVIFETEFKSLKVQIVETDAGVSIIAFNEHENVGKIDCYHKEYFPYPNVDTSMVIPSWRGMGLGKFLYVTLIEYFGGLISDKYLTGKDGEGTIKVWEWLSIKYFAYKIKKELDNTYTIKPIVKINRRHMGKKEELFMVSKKRMEKN
jgi:GNAT superfamily N-acetyltransferase